MTAYLRGNGRYYHKETWLLLHIVNHNTRTSHNFHVHLVNSSHMFEHIPVSTQYLFHTMLITDLHFRKCQFPLPNRKNRVFRSSNPYQSNKKRWKKETFLWWANGRKRYFSYTNDCHLPCEISKCIFVKINVWILIQYSPYIIKFRGGILTISQLWFCYNAIKPQYDWQVLTLYMLIFSDRTKYIYVLCHSSIFVRHRKLKYFLKKDKDLSILHSQYHGCWCPGDARSQGINNHDIDLVKPR